MKAYTPFSPKKFKPQATPSIQVRLDRYVKATFRSQYAIDQDRARQAYAQYKRSIQSAFCNHWSNN